VRVSPELNIYDEQWPIWTTRSSCRRPSSCSTTKTAAVRNRLHGVGRLHHLGSRVSNSLLFSQVRVHDYSTVDRSVILPRVRIGEHCVIRNAIIDEGAVVPDGTTIASIPCRTRTLLRQRERRYARHRVDAARPARAGGG